jgi:hypothetical protein
MSMRSTLGLAIFCAAILAQPAAGQSGDIVLAGHISEAMAAKVHAAFGDGKPHTLHLTSSGGEEAPALAIAREMADHRAALVVEGVCAGPCANYLFRAAARRTILPGALVIFSTTATSRLAMVPSRRRDEIRPDYLRMAELEKKLPGNAALLLEPQLRLGTQCYSLTSRDGAGRAYINYRADFVGWIPSRAYLEKANLHVSGFWPRTVDAFQAALKSAFPGGLRGEIRFAGTNTPAPAAKSAADLAAIPECDKGSPARAATPPPAKAR